METKELGASRALVGTGLSGCSAGHSNLDKDSQKSQMPLQGTRAARVTGESARAGR